MTNRHTLSDLKVRQQMPLDMKIIMSQRRIREFCDRFPGMTYISNSGGVDSTVLSHMVCSLYPKTPNIFINTGLEYPENVEHARKAQNLIEVRPKMSFYQVIQKYGYPVISKGLSQQIHEYRTTKSDKLRKKRLHGDQDIYKTGKIPERWKFLINAPFMISERCCWFLKKEPAKRYEKETGRHPFIGTMANESRHRSQSWIVHGCNAFELNRPQSRPLSFWTKDDIWSYIKLHNLEYSTIYDKGIDRTGCIFCLFGIHREKIDRFEILKRTHPELHTYCMERLGIKDVLEFIRNKGELTLF